jgi:hypothetical protein
MNVQPPPAVMTFAGHGRIDRRVAFLGGQTLLMGMLAGFIIIPASGLFLARYGSENLPWVYGAIAAVAVVGTSALARAVRRHHIAKIAVPILVGVAAITLVAWIELVTSGHPWVSAPLLVLFPLSYQTGFVLIGGQAGLLFDVGEMKAHFPRVVAGFPLGFVVSGVVGSVVIEWFGDAKPLLLFSAICTLAMLALVRMTQRRFSTLQAYRPLPTSRSPVRSSAAPSIRMLLRTPLVAGLLAYQLLSQVGTQLVDFLVYDRAAVRYSSGDRLSSFVSNFTSVLNVVDLIFLVVAAGFLLRRFGMRVGVVLNPLVVTLFVVAALVSSASTGTASMVTLVFMCAARVSDISLTDGATRGALNTAFQAVNESDRMAAQAVIEGAGMPLAIGVTGAVILVLQRVVHLKFGGMAVFTVAVCCVWVIVGQLVFRRYRGALRSGLASRLVQPDESFATAASRDVGGIGNVNLPATLETSAALIRSLRARFRDGQVSAEELIEMTAHPNRKVGLRACQLLASNAALNDPRLGGVGPAMARNDHMVASKILRAMVILDEHRQHLDSTRVEVLRRSLDDELRVLQQRALAVLSLTNDRRLVADSARPLRWGNTRAQALAVDHRTC